MVVLASIGGGLWHGQAQDGIAFYFGVKFDLKGQRQSTPTTIWLLTHVFCTSGSNLVILV